MCVCERMLRCKQLWFGSRKRRLRLSPRLYWRAHRVTWPAKTPQVGEYPPFHSICKKRKLGQCADQLCRRRRRFYVFVWFAKADASAFQRKIHTRVTSLWTQPFVAPRNDFRSTHRGEHFRLEVVIWVYSPPPTSIQKVKRENGFQNSFKT